MICTSKHGALPDWLEILVLETAIWIKNRTDDWLTVKFELVACSPADQRCLFSRIKPGKGPRINKFERKIIARWWQLTNVQLKLRPSKTLVKGNEIPSKDQTS